MFLLLLGNHLILEDFREAKTFLNLKKNSLAVSSDI